MTDFLRDPAPPPPLDLAMIDPALLADAPDRLLAVATDLLLSGDAAPAASTSAFLTAPGRR